MIVKTEDLKNLSLFDEIQVSGTLYCVNRELPYLAHQLKATIVSGWLEEENGSPDGESWIGLETGVKDLDDLELFISLDPSKIQPRVTLLWSSPR